MPLAASWTRPKAGTAQRTESSDAPERLTGPFLSTGETSVNVARAAGGKVKVAVVDQVLNVIEEDGRRDFLKIATSDVG